MKSPQTARALSFGLLIPDLGETEIFEPICQGMMASPLAREHALIWGSPSGASKEERAWQLCRQYIDRGVSGVFFAPLEGIQRQRRHQPTHCAMRWTRREFRSCCWIARSCPTRTRASRSGRASTIAAPATSSRSTCSGSERGGIAFMAMPNAAATVDAREAGYREALYTWQRRSIARWCIVSIHRIPSAVRAVMEAAVPDAIVCANDRTALV